MSPNTILGSEEESDVAEHPSLKLRRFSNVDIIHNARFNALVTQSKLLIPERRQRGPWSLYKGRYPRRTGLIHGQSGNEVAVLRSPVFSKLQSALYVGTRAPYNWYHWLANTLPSIFIANRANLGCEVPLLLATEIKEYPQMLESLGMFLGNREIIWLPRDKRVRVGNLYWADCPVYDSPFSKDALQRMPLILHLEAMKDFRNQVLTYSFDRLKTVQTPSKIFLGRSPGSSRPYNSDDVEKWVKNLGFTVVYTERLSFIEQVSLFHNASYIIGPTGASWANVIFCSSIAKGLRLLRGSQPYENYFSNLAAVSGMDLWDLPCQANNQSAEEEGFLVNKRELESAVEYLLTNT